MGILGNLPSKAIMDVRKTVERYVRDKAEKDVWATSVYAAKPDIKNLFPVPFNANYEKHMGPVTGICCSPFLKRLFLSCSSDGAVRLYDVLNHRPCAIFEPGYNEYLFNIAWSPFRPAVFACISNLGTIYIYDLALSKQVPSYVLKYQEMGVGKITSSKERVAYSIMFNPRQRDFLAVGFHDGCVRIYQLNYALANRRNDELKIMQSYLEEKGTE